MRSATRALSASDGWWVFKPYFKLATPESDSRNEVEPKKMFSSARVTISGYNPERF